MMQGFDELLEVLSEKIVLRGDQGARLVDFQPWIEDYFHGNRYHVDDVSQNTTVPAKPRQVVDTRFCRTVWGWLKSREGFHCEERDSDQQNGTSRTASDSRTSNHDGALTTSGAAVSGHKKSLDLNSSNIASQREETIVADPEVIWQAIAGHGIDHTKVPPLEFKLLGLIAAAGEAGIAQPELVHTSGQDKRSVPKRTLNLMQKGYIDKTGVIAAGTWTSLLKLRRFAVAPKPAAEPGVTFETKTPAEIKQEIFEDGVAHGDRFVIYTLAILKANGIMNFADYRERLGLVNDRDTLRTAKAILHRMNKQGWIGLGGLQAQDANGNPKLSKAIKFVREPTKQEYEAFNRHKSEPGSQLNTEDTFDDEDLDDNDGPGLAPLDEVARIDTPYPGPSPWTPDVQIQALIFDVIDEAGFDGLIVNDIRNRLGLQFFSKPMEQILSRMTDFWTVSQPAHLQHLGIIKDEVQIGKFRQYNYFSKRNFEARVRAGLTTWDSLLATCKDSVRRQKTSLNPELLEDLDEQGFRRLSLADFLNNDGLATPSDCLEKHRGKPQKKRGRPSLKDRASEARRTTIPSNKTPLVIQSQTHTALGHDTRPTGEASTGTSAVAKVTSVQSAKPIQDISALRIFTKRTHVMAEAAVEREMSSTSTQADSPGQERPLKRLRHDDHSADVVVPPSSPGTQPTSRKRAASQSGTPSKPPKIPRLEAGRSGTLSGKTSASLEDWHAQYMQMSIPGIYINPPQCKRRGRPPVEGSILAVFKSDSLRRFEWFTSDPAKGLVRHDVIFPTNDDDEAGRDDEASNDDVRTPNDVRQEPSVDHGQTNQRTSRLSPTPIQNPVPFSIPSVSRNKDEVAQSKMTVGREAAEAIEEPETPHRPEPQRGVDSSTPLQISSRAETHPAGTETTPAGDVNPKHIPGRGNVHRLRSKVIIDILERCGGVYPGGGEIYYPFWALWIEYNPGYGKDRRPDPKTAKKAVDNLINYQKVIRYNFAFKDGKGAAVTKSVLALSSIGPDDEAVKRLQEHMIERYPHAYLPAESPVAPGIRERLAQKGGHSLVKGRDDLPVSAEERPKGYHPNWADFIDQGVDEPQTLQRVPWQRIDLMGEKPLTEDEVAQAQRHIEMLEANIDEEQGMLQSSFQLAGYHHEPEFRVSHKKPTARISKIANLDPELPAAKPAPRPVKVKVNPHAWIFCSSEMPKRRKLFQGKEYCPTMTDPDQEFTPSNGTFSTVFAPLRRARPRMNIDVNAHRELEEEMPEDLDDLVRRVRQDGQTGSQSMGSALQQFEDVAAWEMQHQETLTSNKQLAQVRFINHTVELEMWNQPVRTAVRTEALQKLKAQTIERTRRLRLKNAPPKPKPQDQATATPRKKPGAPIVPASQRLTFVTGPSRRERLLAERAAAKDSAAAKQGTQATTANEEAGEVVADEAPVTGGTLEETAAPVDRTHRQKILRGRRNKNLFTTEEIRRLFVCGIVVRVLTGGQDRTMDFARIHKLYGNMEVTEAFIKQKFATLYTQHKPMVKRIEADFQQAFVAAYREGVVAAPNYDDLDAYDWGSLVQWVDDNMEAWTAQKVKAAVASGEASLSLPGDRKTLEEKHTIRERLVPYDVDKLEDFNLRAVNIKREQLLLQTSFEIPIRSGREKGAKDGEAKSEEKEVAQNLVRANLLTPEERYKPEAARERLAEFSEATLDSALRGLMEDNIVKSKSKEGRALPGRNYRMSDMADKQVQRVSLTGSPGILRDAVRYKEGLDEALGGGERQESKVYTSYHARDGEVLALLNLVTAGRVKLEVELPAVSEEPLESDKAVKDANEASVPQQDRVLSKWGFTTDSYKTLGMSNVDTVFPIRVLPTERYVEGCGQLNPRPEPPGPSAWKETRPRMTAYWYDIHGELVEELFEKLAAAVVATMVVRPGVTAGEIMGLLGKVTGVQEWEIEQVLGWLEQAGAAEQLEGSRGWTTKEWWWWVVGNGRRLDTATTRTGRVEERLGTFGYSRGFDAWRRG